MALQRLVMGIAAPIDFVNIAERSANDGLIEKSRLFSIAAIKSPPYLADS